MIRMIKKEFYFAVFGKKYFGFKITCYIQEKVAKMGFITRSENKFPHTEPRKKTINNHPESDFFLRKKK